MRGQRDLVRGVPARAGLHLVRAVAAAVLVFVVARAAWYPFWASGADHAQLENSWGGPNPFGATVAHWLVAGLIGGVCVGMWMVSTRLLREQR